MGGGTEYILYSKIKGKNKKWKKLYEQNNKNLRTQPKQIVKVEYQEQYLNLKYITSNF